jgi:hypothetical protein
MPELMTRDEHCFDSEPEQPIQDITVEINLEDQRRQDDQNERIQEDLYRVEEALFQTLFQIENDILQRGNEEEIYLFGESLSRTLELLGVGGRD